jgi:hypothetical protein
MMAIRTFFLGCHPCLLTKSEGESAKALLNKGFLVNYFGHGRIHPN